MAYIIQSKCENGPMQYVPLISKLQELYMHDRNIFNTINNITL